MSSIEEGTIPGDGLPGVDHIALTVQDLDHAITWYEKVIGVPPERTGKTDTFRFASWQLGNDARIVLHEFGESKDRDDEPPTPGLHHLSLKCGDRATLESWADRFDRAGIDHGGIRDEGHASILSVEAPDGTSYYFYLRTTESPTTRDA